MPAFAALSAELRQSSRCWGRTPQDPAALPGWKDQITASIDRSCSDAHDEATSGRYSGKGGSSFGHSACGCNSRRRASTAGSAESQTASDVRSWRARPGAPSGRMARTAAAVRSEAWGEAAATSGAAPLFWARAVRARAVRAVRAGGDGRGPSVAACRRMRLIRSPNGSITTARQLSRHCWVEGAARAMRGIRDGVPGSPMFAHFPGPAGRGRDRDPVQRGGPGS